MLAREPAEKLLQLLSNRVDTAKRIHEMFQSYFPLNVRFSVSLSISLMLLDRVLDHYQQIASIYILYAEFPDKMSENPFLNVFLQLNDQRTNCPQTFSPVLNRILPLLTMGASLSFLDSLTIPQILDEQFQNLSFPQISHIKPEMEIQRIPNFISQPNTDSQTFSQIKEKCENLSHQEFLMQYLTSDGFVDEFEVPTIRPIPSVSPVFHGEIQHLLISSPAPPPFLYDISIEDQHKEEAAKFLKLAMTKKLTDVQTKIVLDYGITDSLYLKESDLTNLIENNSDIAVAVVLKMYEKKQKTLEYLYELPVTVKNVEVAKGVALSLKDKEIVKQFIHKYAISAISSINSLPDNSILNTKSRLLCRFLFYLKNNNIEFTPDLKVELQSFCMDLTKKGITEAQDLFSIL